MMQRKKIYLASPYMGKREMEYMQRAYESNWIAPLGPFVNRLENDICDYVGCDHAVALNSGTSAIHLALIEAGVGKDDIVFCSDLTFTASANPIRYCGAKPVFIDSEPLNSGMSPDALEEAFNIYSPKAVVVASIYGVPARLDEIKEICDSHDVVMIEDSTEVLGAKLYGKYAGTFGKYGTYSFNGNKIITTSGGGMLISDDERSIKHALFLATQAKDTDATYAHSELGYNYRLSNVSAAIGVAQLENIGEIIGKKKRLFMSYKSALADYEKYGVKMMHIPAYSEPNYWLSVIMLPQLPFLYPSEIVGALKGVDIEARRTWKPLHTQKLWKGADFITTQDDAHSKYFYEHSVCLPSDINMDDSDFERVVENIRALIDDSVKMYYHQGN